MIRKQIVYRGLYKKTALKGEKGQLCLHLMKGTMKKTIIMLLFACVKVKI